MSSCFERINTWLETCLELLEVWLYMNLFPLAWDITWDLLWQTWDLNGDLGWVTWDRTCKCLKWLETFFDRLQTWRACSNRPEPWLGLAPKELKTTLLRRKQKIEIWKRRRQKPSLRLPLSSSFSPCIFIPALPVGSSYYIITYFLKQLSSWAHMSSKLESTDDWES